ncbi:MAG: pyridoxine 5'-phosphate synthase [Candidatus Marinimicrobia bacterium]|nr:pyridoxine 5'-phosphate synthase [Candidatus Neomarinimicrobiota bacterium]
MSYLELNLDPFISLWRELDTSVSNPLNLLGYVESSYTGGISFTYKPDIPLFSEISTIKKLTNSRINIRITPDKDILKKVLDLAPDVITICNPENKYSTIDLPSKRISNIIGEAQKNKLPIIPRIVPDIKQLKYVYKLKCSEAELATNRLSKAASKTKFNTILNHLTKCYKVAQKNNLRISFGGNLDKRLILALNSVTSPEFYSMGRYLLSFAMIKGIDNVLEDTVETILK